MTPTSADGPSAETLVLWDADDEPPAGESLVWRWSGYAETHAVRSLLRYAEEHGDRLRRAYLRWIHRLGESQICGKRLIDHLVLEGGQSYWWLTQLAEKSPYKSPISDAIRLMALEEIVASQPPKSLRLVSRNRRLHEAVGEWCEGLGVAYRWERRSARRLWPTRRGLSRVLPLPVRSLISLARYLGARWVFRQAARPAWFSDERSVFVCSYFDNVDREAARSGTFRSHYWDGFPNLCHRLKRRINWVHLYVPGAGGPDPGTAMEWLRGFHRAGYEQGKHALLDTFLSWTAVLRVLRRLAWLSIASWQLRAISRKFRVGHSQLSLWPIMRSDWEASLRGPVAVANLLWLECFDAALRDVPRQELGFYLCENQGWERALIYAWRKNGHGRLMAVAHSTVRYWDLRYLADPRTIGSTQSHPMPQPDAVVLNGQAALDVFEGAGYPNDAIVEGEALRYGYLTDLHIKRGSLARSNGRQVLVLGDVMFASTARLLALLEAAVPLTSAMIAFAVKSHPNCPIKAADYPTLGLRTVTDQLGQVLAAFDIVYASNTTSAAVDAYLAGVPVIVMLDQSTLNLSPLRGQPGVRFVSTAGELAAALEAAPGASPTSDSRKSDMFFLDSSLPRWTRLLEG